MAYKDDVETYKKLCKQIAGDDFDEMSKYYSFESAYSYGLTPEQAIKDCKEWLES